MDNGAGRHPMAETVYGTEDSTMVMSEKVISSEKSIVGGGEKKLQENSRKIKDCSEQFPPYALLRKRVA